MPTRKDGLGECLLFLWCLAYPITVKSRLYPIAGDDETPMLGIRQHHPLPTAPRRLITHADWSTARQVSDGYGHPGASDLRRRDSQQWEDEIGRVLEIAEIVAARCRVQ